MTRSGHARNGRAPVRQRARVTVVAGFLIVAASVLTACTSPGAQFDEAVGQGFAAVETARLAVALAARRSDVPRR